MALFCQVPYCPFFCRRLLGTAICNISIYLRSKCNLLGLHVELLNL